MHYIAIKHDMHLKNSESNVESISCRVFSNFRSVLPQYILKYMAFTFLGFNSKEFSKLNVSSWFERIYLPKSLSLLYI